MNCGKSTLALQMDYNHRVRRRGGVLFTRYDRAGEAVISSRLGLRTPAVEVAPGTDFRAEVVRRRTRGTRLDYLIFDEAQWYLFPGSQRLIELSDHMQVLEVGAAALPIE